MTTILGLIGALSLGQGTFAQSGDPGHVSAEQAREDVDAISSQALETNPSPFWQTGQNNLNSTHDAIVIAEAAFEAHGRIDNFAGVTIMLEGRYDLSARYQGRTLDGPDWTPISELISVELPQGRVAYEANFHNYTNSRQHLIEIHDAGPLFIDLRAGSGGYLPFTLTDDAKQRFRRYLPQLMLTDALANRASMRRLGSTRFLGCEADSLDYATDVGHRITLYLDRDTHLVCGASIVAMMPIIGDTEFRYRWSEYQEIDGAIVPGYFASFVGSRALKESRMSVTFQLDDAALSPPGGVDVGESPEQLGRLSDFMPAGQRRPRVEQVAEGVFMINDLRPGFRTPFIEFEDFVLVVDAPAGYYDIQQIPPLWGSPGDDLDSLGEKILSAVEATLPGKPVRYLALTHFHSDHIAGLRPIVREGATVVASQPTVAAARRAIVAPNWLSGIDGGPIALEVDIFEGRRVIADENMEVHLLELPADNPKAEGFAVVYIPHLNFLYSTGFIYPVPEGQPPPPESIELAAWFADWLDASGLEIDTHYNVHSAGLVEQRHIDEVRTIAAGRSAGTLR